VLDSTSEAVVDPVAGDVVVAGPVVVVVEGGTYGVMVNRAMIEPDERMMEPIWLSCTPVSAATDVLMAALRASF
jgi:hypothetical protein